MGAEKESTSSSPPKGDQLGRSFPNLDLTLPDAFGQYVLFRELSRTKKGVIFLATSQKLGAFHRLCVIKVVDPTTSSQQDFEERFTSAGRRLVHLDHRNVGQVFDTGQTNNVFYFAQEHVLGCSLEEVIDQAEERGETVPVDLAVLIVVDILRALYHALRQPGPDGHPLKLWHGQVSPNHVLISAGGEVKLIGFDREWEGTPVASERTADVFIAPELETVDEGGPRADVYSAARLLQSILGPDFEGSDAIEAFDEIRPGLGELIVRAASTEYEARPRDVGSLLRPLSAALYRLNPKCNQENLADYIQGVVGKLLDRRKYLSRSMLRSQATTAQTIQTEPPLTRTLLLEADEPVRARAMDRVVADAKPLIGLLPGTKYRILRAIGEGGMGTVYAAEHVDLEKVFALKILRQKRQKDRANVVEGLRREARATSKLGHPNIVSVTDFGEIPDGRVFFVMEYLEGQSLGELLEDSGTIEQEKFISILIQVCDGLAAAHEKGVIHRDIKPDNIFLVHNRDGTESVKLLDFGVAVPIGAAKNKSSHIAGTPYYMSPEMIRMKPLDGRSDLYSLGVLAYEALCGRRPFGRAPVLQLLRAHLKEVPPPLSGQPGGESIHGVLEAIVMKTLEKDPRDRFQDASSMAAELRDLTESLQANRDQKKAIRAAGFDSEEVRQDIEETWTEALSQIEPEPEPDSKPPVPLAWRLPVALLGLAAISAFVVFIFYSTNWTSSGSQGANGAVTKAGIKVSPRNGEDALARDGGVAAVISDAGSFDAMPFDGHFMDFTLDGGFDLDGALEDDAESLDDRRKSPRSRPSRSLRYVAAGYQALAAGEMSDAVTAFERALVINSRQHAATAGLGRVAFQQRDYTKAETYARRALERSPRSARYRLDLGAALFRQGKVDDAALLFMQVLHEHPDNRAAQRYLEATKR